MEMIIPLFSLHVRMNRNGNDDDAVVSLIVSWYSVSHDDVVAQIVIITRSSLPTDDFRRIVVTKYYPLDQDERNKSELLH